jgi:ComF family protein
VNRRIRDWLRLAGAATIETVYPRRCAGCGLRGVWVCDECFALVPLDDEPKCPRCGVPIGFSRCRCPDLALEIDRFRAVGPYRQWLGASIRYFKYGGERARGDHLGELLASRINEFLPFDCLVPVPLHRSRIRERGFNQAAILANVAGELLGVPVEEVLARNRDTGHQARLGADDRRVNVRGAFAVPNQNAVAGRRLVLVDDVMTTGSTLNACAKVLIEAGASWVGAVVLAREV